MKKLLPLLILIISCGGNAPQTETPATEKPDVIEEKSTVPPKEAEPPPPAPITDVTRAELDEVLKKGPPYVLAMVQMDSVKQNGKFVGFKVISFRTEAPTILGLQPDDVVQRVNQLPIERPEQLLAIFEKLKTATEIEFSILRNNEKMMLKTPVQ